MSESNRFEGYIDYYNEVRGFGFIRTDERRGEKFFVHASNVAHGVPRSGRSVSFEIGRTQRGPCATNVKVHGGGM